MSGVVGAAIRGISKILLNKGKKTSSTISSVKTAKNLAGRRKDRDAVVAGVDKHLKSSDPTSSKIKKEFTKKTSAIYDKIDKK